MKNITLLTIVLFVFFTLKTQAQILRGTVRDADSKTALAGAILVINSTKDAATLAQIVADSSGRFISPKLSPRSYYRLTINYLGYQTTVLDALEVVAGKELVLDIALQSKSIQLAEAQITPDNRINTLPNNPIGTITLTRDQINRYPTMFFDPVRLAAASAGVAQTDDGSNGISIRGNSTANVGWRLEGAEIVNPNHLPNAGTFSDFAATSSGGVLMFSSQMMGNSTLFKGNYPVGYGNALGGIMDMTLRNGNENQREFTVQAGLTGLDLAAEGPLSNKKNSSYIANYRYSTVGILGGLGFSFGGEKITFQDGAFKLNFKHNKGYTSVLGMVGLSSNVFKGAKDSSELKINKDFYNITFESKTGIIGISNFWQINAKSWLKTNGVLSGQTNHREVFRDPSIFRDSSSQIMNRDHLKSSFNAQYSKLFNLQNQLTLGLNFNQSQEKYSDTSYYEKKFQSASFIVWTYFDYNQGYMHVQPFASWKTTFANNHITLNFGVQYNKYNFKRYNQKVFKVPNYSKKNFEPNFALNYAINKQQSIGLFANFSSQKMLASIIEYEYMGIFINGEDKSINRVSADKDLQKSRNFSVEYKLQIGENWQFKTAFFHQFLTHIPITSFNKLPFNLLNYDQIGYTINLKSTGKGINYGAEFSLNRNLKKGWFMNINTTIFESKTLGSDQIWRDSRWAVGHLSNYTLGKEWHKVKKNERFKVFGVSLRAVQNGGLREQLINENESTINQSTTYDYLKGFDIKLPNYFRLDTRFYWKKSIADRRNQIFALEFQNLTNQKNIAYYYYDAFTQKIETKYQLGLIPNVSWRLEF
jgi:hypothetical protein